MPSALGRIVIAFVAVQFIGLHSLVAPCLFDSQAFAASSEVRQEKPRKTRGTHANTSSVSLVPAIIQNLRSTTSPGLNRLVLDLDRRTRVKKHYAPKPNGVIAEIPNATLSKSAQTKLARGSIAKPFVITQVSSHSVAVSLPNGSFQRYHLLSLTNPPRLVVDVVPSNQLGVTQPTEAPDPSLPPSPPSQPVPPPTKSFRTIVVDPGHGGRDPGAKGLRGTEEKDITLKVGLKLRDLLKRQPGVRVMMTRDRDVFVELEDRAKYANNLEADLFVSIHVNSHPQRTVKGIEIYHFGEAKDQRALEVAARENGTPLSSTGVGWEYLVADLLTTKKIEESLELAWTTKEAMVAHMNGHYATVDHGVKTAPFYVLRFTSMPSILAEIAYVSNPSEETLLRTDTFVNRVAESLNDGVKAFLSSAKQPAR
ncbi:MAG TPA: N-acetylmuramoyl-L-alanine amidase [Nitrospiraceae bacterium]|nr:N-acetylmuramoyl-L-alanine amidase [Nitrospiraceae bacterium]